MKNKEFNRPADKAALAADLISSEVLASAVKGSPRELVRVEAAVCAPVKPANPTRAMLEVLAGAQLSSDAANAQLSELTTLTGLRSWVKEHGHLLQPCDEHQGTRVLDAGYGRTLVCVYQKKGRDWQRDRGLWVMLAADEQQEEARTALSQQTASERHAADQRDGELSYDPDLLSPESLSLADWTALDVMERAARAGLPAPEITPAQVLRLAGQFCDSWQEVTGCRSWTTSGMQVRRVMTFRGWALDVIARRCNQTGEVTAAIAIKLAADLMDGTVGAYSSATVSGETARELVPDLARRLSAGR